jgi:hypothetical protein
MPVQTRLTNYGKTGGKTSEAPRRIWLAGLDDLHGQSNQARMPLCLALLRREGSQATPRGGAEEDLSPRVPCVCVYLFNGQRPVPITQVLNIPCWDKSRQVVKPGFQIYIYNLGPQRISIAALGGQ